MSAKSPPEGYRLLLVSRNDCDSGHTDYRLFAVNASISFQLRWDEYHKDGDECGHPSGALLASFKPGTDLAKFVYDDDIRGSIRLPPDSMAWEGGGWEPCADF
ncbi:MAG: hypothetical protein WAT81_03220 [Candidatus Moraniibacteriota bacterium]